MLKEITCNSIIINDVLIRRDAEIPLQRFTDHFKGFERVEAVRELFGDQTKKVLKNLKVEFSSRRGYMGVSSLDGHLIVSTRYLRNGDASDIYLDVIHELVHVKQFRNGIELHDRRFNYSNRPTEVEAYAHTVREARKIGMSEERIYEYLQTEWMSEEEVNQLADAVGVHP
jgi:hypothetical protein